ncbi:aquacobalamin reductase / NAD(P)H-flavin reductase [Pseudoalteromonas rubra]|uniref:FMN reductase n=1 Tax=Pseudoalteromonas rubra TaxID=43658 RepID=A0A0L0EVW2_9GAMM|nr:MULTISPECIES: NAD(P)H-flavin reductase [Pseudoalteromonas]ALU43720.1 NAD(P)H-flavin reductase [Pseudoalteromonas rubra]KAF7787581.1 aquacobalamin reductase / NAD(P)H-flavin reductase [Pseudoalteromonas rubra]KNC68566.1 FMN reductase [Pseudoalteromonas rubra]MDK1314214.1 NAD(P)H-flavin reductase [Pseudoalteromonas sp. R96]
MQVLKATVAEISSLTEYVSKVVLTPEQDAEFAAGHYLQLVLGEKDKRAFSIASSPSKKNALELHIGASGADSYAMQALDHLKAAHTNQTQVDLEVGLGVSQVRPEQARPLVLLAGGTGFSYVKSMADHLAEINYDQPVLFYWGVKEESALYAKADMEAWANSKANFQFIPVVEHASEHWKGHTGYVHQAVMKDIVSLEPYSVYMAGRFDMIGIVRDDFINHGAQREFMFADAFAFIK